MKPTKHTELILQHIMDNGSITPWEAIAQYNCLRLSARIFDIRELGINIVTEMIQEHNKTYARYHLGNAERNVITKAKINKSITYLKLMK